MKLFTIILFTLITSTVSYGQKVIAAEGTGGNEVTSEQPSILDNTDLKLAQKNWKEGIEFIKAGHELKQKSYELKDPELIKQATKKYVDANYSFHQALLAYKRFNALYPGMFPELNKMNEKPYQEKIDRAKELIAKESEEYNFVAGLKKGETVYHLTPGKTLMKPLPQDWNTLYVEHKNKPAEISKTTVTDSDNLTVKIGNQIWMAKNLDVDKFRNGDPIPQAKSPEEWKKACYNHQPVWCYIEYSQENGETFGKLYNWYAVIDSRGLAPYGFHIPQSSEFKLLVNFLGGQLKAADALKGGDLWLYDKYKQRSKSSGFNALPGGRLFNEYGTSSSTGVQSKWWSITYYDDSKGTLWGINIQHHSSVVDYSSIYNYEGCYIRCLKD